MSTVVLKEYISRLGNKRQYVNGRRERNHDYSVLWCIGNVVGFKSVKVIYSPSGSKVIEHIFEDVSP